MTLDADNARTIVIRADSQITTTSLSFTLIPTASSTVVGPTTYFSTNPNAYLPPKSTVIRTSTTAPSVYLPTSVPDSTAEPGTSSSNPDAYLPTVSTILVTTNQQAYLSTTTLPPTLSASQGLYIPTETTLFSTSGAAYLPTGTEVHITTRFSTDASGYVQTLLSTYTTKLKTGPTPSPSEGDNSDSSGNTTWPLWWVFVAGYLPLLLAILLKLIWISIEFNIKLVAPFIQLSHSDGALASDALFTHYLSSNMTPAFISALVNKQYLMFWTSITSLIVGFLAPLASEVLFLDTHYDCGTENCWPPKLSANGIILRLLQGLLSFVAIMTIVITVMFFRSSTGIYSNPSSIASVASLIHHPDVLDDFRNMDPDLSLLDMAKQIGDKRYYLGTYKAQNEIWRYGLAPASQQYAIGWTKVPLGPTASSPTPHPERPESTKAKKNSHQVSTALDLVVGLFTLGVLGVVVAYYIDGSNSGFNRFFNSNSFGPRFLMVRKLAHD